MNYIFLFLILSISSKAFAKNFAYDLSYKTIGNPTQDELRNFRTSCDQFATKVKAKMDFISEHNKDLELNNVVGRSWIQREDWRGTSAPIGIVFTCNARISGNLRANLNFKVVELYETLTHLKLMGYTKEEFPSACKGISQALTSNIFELFQKIGTGFSLKDGNFCYVYSKVAVFY